MLLKRDKSEDKDSLQFRWAAIWNIFVVVDISCPDPEYTQQKRTAEIKAHVSDVAARPSPRNRIIHSVNQCSSSAF